MTIAEEIRRKWKPRDPRSHKGDYGRVLVVAGSRGMAGAAHLAAFAALRAGAGLVSLAVPDSIYTVAARRRDEIMVRPVPSTKAGTLARRALPELLRFSENQDVLAVGPGLSQNTETRQVIRNFIARTQAPVVLDADGLNAFRGRPADLSECYGRTSALCPSTAPPGPRIVPRGGRAVLTPHPGEFLRLFGGTLSRSDPERKKRAAEIARRFKVILVLKGFHTVTAGPDGKTYTNRTGNPGMATGGAGDVLTGIIAALIAQKFSLWDAARFGVYLHGLAGDLAAKKIGGISLMAGDLLDFLPAAIRKSLE